MGTCTPVVSVRDVSDSNQHLICELLSTVYQNEQVNETNRFSVRTIGKFVILRYDKILHTECAKPLARKSSKASSKKSAKSFLAKKSAKLTAQSSWLGKGLHSLVSGIINYNFGLSAFILPKSGVKITHFWRLTVEGHLCVTDQHTVKP